MKWNRRSCTSAAGALLALSSTFVLASTDSFSGTVKSVRPGRTAGTVTEVTEVTGIDYQSSPTRWIGSVLTHSTQPNGLTATAIEGRLISPEAYAKAIQPGMHGMVYEGLWRDRYVQPKHVHGRLVQHDPASKTLTLQSHRTIKTTHWPEAAPVMTTVTYGDDTGFYIENDKVTLEQALNEAGSYLQVFPARPQLVMVETDEGKFDENTMPAKGGRGGANKHCSIAIFVGESDKGMEFRVQRNGEWQAETITKKLKQRKAWLDGQINPFASYALKPGRRCWLATYRNGDQLMILYMSTRKGEIDGVVSKVDGNTITFAGGDLDPDAGEHTVTLEESGRILVDGSEGEASAIQVGQYIRVFPARTQSVVALRSWTADGKGGFLPVASFRSDESVLGTQTVEFDASSSYGHGQDIASYAWDFGDGNTGDGEKVSHTFADAPYGNYWVTLTVTDAAGGTSSTKHRIVVAPEMLPAVSDVAVADLQSGYRYKHWPDSIAKIKGDEAKVAKINEIVATEPAMNIGIEKFQFERKEKQPGAGRAKGVRELSGYILAPKDGWYAVAVVGGQQLFIDGHEVLRYDGALKQGYVPLQAGLHSFRQTAETQDNYIRFSWMHPDGTRVLPEGTKDGDFKGLTRWQCYRPLQGSLFYTK